MQNRHRHIYIYIYNMYLKHIHREGFFRCGFKNMRTCGFYHMRQANGPHGGPWTPGGAELLRSGAVRPDVQTPRGCGQGRPCARRRLLTFAYKPGPRTRCAQEAHCESVQRELHGGEYANEAHGQVNEEVGQKKWESPMPAGRGSETGVR